MKYFLALLVTILLPFPAPAGVFFGTNNRTVIHNYGAAPAADYFGSPPPRVYYSAPAPYPDGTVESVQIYSVPVYADDAGVVRVRHREKHRGNRYKIYHKEISR